MNCPLTSDGHVLDDSRIVAALPTIKLAQERGAKVILASHLGRPKGRVKKDLTMQPVGIRLAEHLDQDILFPDDCIGDGPRKLVTNLRERQVVLLENLRFHPGESQNDDTFARGLAGLAQVYINDAFGAAHRAHASVVGVARLMPERAAGLLMIDELKALSSLMTEAEAPFVVAIGGAKVAGKIGVIEHLLSRANTVLIGGAMAYTFLKARGFDVGASRVETDKIPLAQRVLTKAEAMKTELLLPTDHVCAHELAADAPHAVYRNGEVPTEQLALDIGPETMAIFKNRIDAAKTIFWNGPMGVFEHEAFAVGTKGIAHAVAHSTARSVVGGGDSLAAVRQAGVTPFISHISTGGGASLELLEGRDLPGVEALRIGRAVTDG